MAKFRRTAIFTVVVLTILFSGFIILKNKHKTGIPRMSFSEFEPYLHRNNDTIYVINFWATWCRPCVKELPAFEELRTNFKNQRVKVILVSLDFPNKDESLLLPYIEQHQIKSQVIHLVDVNANAWIDKVSPEWSGAIPATYIYRKDWNFFHEGSMTFDKLNSIINTKIDNL